MAIKKTKKAASNSKRHRTDVDLHPSAQKSGVPRSKLLKFDTEVPGDRGDYEKETTVQGSE